MMNCKGVVSYISLVSTDDGGSYYFGEFRTNRVQAYRIKTLGTPNLTWEVAKKYDIGVDFSVLNGKFTGAVDYFVDKRDDIFMQRNQMPLTTGLADQTPMANVGKMKSFGWDGNIAFTQQIGQVNLQLRANLLIRLLISLIRMRPLMSCGIKWIKVFS